MAIASRADIMKNLAKGKGTLTPFTTTAGITPTATSNAADGFYAMQIQPNSIGSTLQTTLQSFPLPAGLPNEDYMQFAMAVSTGNVRLYHLARLYKFGTQVLGTTGDQFTHDAATFPVTRKRFGESAKPVILQPMIQLLVAPTVTAPAVKLETAAGGAGYKNQDGSNIAGVNTMTYPSATTVSGTCHYLKLNYGDSGVQDIIALRTTTAGTSSPTANVWGVEYLCPFFEYQSYTPTFQDCFASGLAPVDLAPAVATSGTATSVLCILGVATTNDSIFGWICGALNA